MVVVITRNDILQDYLIIYSEEINIVDDINPHNLLYIEYDYYTNVIIDKDLMFERILYKDFKKRHVLVYPYLRDHQDNQSFQLFQAPKFISCMNYDEQTRQLFISYYIKKDVFEKILQRQVNSHVIPSFIDLLIHKNRYMSDVITRQYVNHLLTPRELNYNVNDINPNTDLYKYQIRDIENMIAMENGMSISRIHQKKPVYNFNNLHFDYNGNLLNEINLNSTIVNYTIRGGFLINEMGLGKTIECLELIHQTSNDNKYIEVLNDNLCCYFYKRGNSKGSYCTKTKKSKYFCTTHQKTPFIERQKYKINFEAIEEDLDSYVSFEDERMKFNSRATLVVCPTQLCDQWVREYYQKFDSKKIVYMITTMEIFQNLTWSELMFCDIIIISYSLLNKIREYPYFYESWLITEWNSLYPERFSHKSEYFSEFKKNVILNRNNSLYLPAQKNIINIKWNRVIFDELHELVDKYTLFDNLRNIEADKKWVITGTPFPNNFKNFQMYFKIFGVYIHDINELFDLNSVSNLFIRNTKESVSHELEKIDMIQNVHLLNFNNYEKNIYMSYLEQLKTKITSYKKEQITNTLLKLCCCGELLTDELKIVIKNCKTFEEIQNVILENNKNQLDIINMQIQRLKIELQDFERDVETDIDESIKIIIANIKKEITIKTKDKETIERSCNYLNSVITAFQSNEHWDCSVCLSSSSDIETIGITSCGHKFCWECLNLSLRDRNFCPQCKKHLKNNDYFEIKKDEDPNINDPLDPLTALINKTKSTKIGNIIMKITSFAEDDKCIVFSQWDDLLNKVGSVLQENNIDIVYCKGTIYQRNNSIKRFKNDKSVKVIMLSSDNAASGLNLTEANKIIFIEPVYGIETHRKNIENQAIGRVNRIGQNKSIEIIRFIIKDTVEEELLI